MTGAGTADLRLASSLQWALRNLTIHEILASKDVYRPQLAARLVRQRRWKSPQTLAARYGISRSTVVRLQREAQPRPPVPVRALHPAESFAANVGACLKQAREQQGLTRSQAAWKFPVRVAAGTLRTWELAKRAMTVVNFVDYCAVLGIDPARVLHDAQRSTVRAGFGSVTLDLKQLQHSDNPRLHQLREWAAHRAGEHGRYLVMTRDQHHALAAFCGLERDELHHVLDEGQTRQSASGSPDAEVPA